MKKQSKLKKSRVERRKDFGKAVDMKWYHTCRGKVPPVYISSSEKIEIKNVMSNKDRRSMGIKQDPALLDYQEEKDE